MAYKQPYIIPVKESGNLYYLDEDYEIDLDPYGYGVTLRIRKGFLYDGATVPRWWWSISGLSRDGIHRAAALVHDYIYVNKGMIYAVTKSGHYDEWRITRKETDRIFKLMLEEVGVANHRVFLAYWGVRLAGGFYWND